MYKENIIVEKKVNHIEEIKSKSYVGFILKKKRIIKGLSQKELSIKLNISRPTISNIEVGRHDVNLKLLKIICLFFDCKSSDFLDF